MTEVAVNKVGKKFECCARGCRFIKYYIEEKGAGQADLPNHPLAVFGLLFYYHQQSNQKDESTPKSRIFLSRQSCLERRGFFRINYFLLPIEAISYFWH